MRARLEEVALTWKKAGHGDGEGALAYLTSSAGARRI